jgi:GNAT superfamily N-acetyltransferase
MSARSPIDLWLHCAAMSTDVAASVNFRVARREELSAILALLTDDAVARSRTGYAEAPTPEVLAAFDEIDRDPNNELLVAELAGEVIATLQLTILPGLSRGGMRRAQVEAVRVRSDLRGQRIGERLMDYAIERARQRGCGLMQLTTDLRRADAHRFYLRLGFEASHAGMKRAI